ncbi:unnamed protein product [Lymnaea stagnalis]|uniref:Lipid droplet-regulating VLDL assembly factor AUP1 n=1 Tax=Lymnaea stagnalis TaxID=6523 RepID=A0AAV2HVV0_LYMST
MLESEFENIISLSRCPNYVCFLPLILYLPIGLALGLIRVGIFLHVCLLSYILPASFPFKCIILRAMLSVAGLPISTQGAIHTDNKKKILIANHVTNLDPFILALLYPSILTFESSTWPSQQHNSKQFVLPTDKSHNDVLKNLKEKVEESNEPLLFFPEKIRTNGKSTLLKFSPLPFEVDYPIQPVTIQVHRYLFDINVSTYASSFYEDLIWCLLLPVTCFKIKCLPITERKKDESREDFANRVQSNMAKSLGFNSSSYSSYDVKDFIKKRKLSDKALQHEQKHEAPRPKHITAEPVSEDDELQRMVKQVKDVLPDTPTHSILTDLKKTRDVDVTITNILEGKISPSKPDVAVPRSMHESLSFKASKFESLALARQLSFAERKQAMLEAARLKYRVKHGL